MFKSNQLIPTEKRPLSLPIHHELHQSKKGQPRQRTQLIKYLTKILILVSLLSVLVYHTIYFNPADLWNDFGSINSNLKFNVNRQDYTTTGGAPSLEPSINHLKIARHGAVACDIPLCSKLGVSILEKGGSSADAAVTVALCIGSINSFSSGIGGGIFITSKPYKKDAISIDAREMAPAKAHKEMYKHKEHLAKYGGLAVAIPGELMGLHTLYQTHSSGKLSWAELIEPVVKLNREGFVASYPLELAVNYTAPFFWENEKYWDYVFTTDEISGNKRLIREGDLIKRPNLANTLELVAQNGSADIFYDSEGPLVKSMVKTIQETGGIVIAQDFANYKVNVEKALHTKFMGQDVYTSAGASSGPALIAGLNIIEGYGSSFAGDGSILPTHRLIEAMKWMASVRSYLGDVLKSDAKGLQDRSARTAKFLTKEWASEVRKNISDDETKSWEFYNPAYQANEPKGTAHFSIVDADDGAVSGTTTVNLSFGSVIQDPVTGVVLNNEMDDFSLPNTPNAFGLQPSIYNFVKPFKRPLSSCSPTIVNNELKSPDFIIGAAGGSRITTAVFEAIVRTYSYGLPLLETIAYPRLHHQLIPEVILAEMPISKSLVEGLVLKGHNVTLIDPLTAMNGIRRFSGDWHAVSDYWRKRGEAWGY